MLSFNKTIKIASLFASLGAVLAAPHNVSGAINAIAAVDGPFGGSSRQGDTTASAEWYDENHAWYGDEIYEGRITSGTGSTDAIFQAYSRTYQRGSDQQAALDVVGAYQDTIFLTGGPALSNLVIRMEVDAALSVPVINRINYGLYQGYYGHGQLGVDFFLGQAYGDASLPYSPPQYATHAFVHINDDVNQAGLQRQTRTQVAPVWSAHQFSTNLFSDVVHFHGEREATLTYDPVLGGYKFGAYLRVQSVSYEAMSIADVMNTVSLTAIMDADGRNLADLGYDVSFRSGMTFPSTAAVPEPASLVSWILAGMTLCFGFLRRFASS